MQKLKNKKYHVIVLFTVTFRNSIKSTTQEPTQKHNYMHVLVYVGMHSSIVICQNITVRVRYTITLTLNQ